jgi:hypothetical protein
MKVWLNVWPPFTGPESQAAAPAGSDASAAFTALDGSSVTVCWTAPVFVHVTVAPAGTLSVAGWNWLASVMLTLNACG